MSGKDEIKGAKTAKSVRTNGHNSSGGHVTKVVTKQSNPAFSRVHRTHWNSSDEVLGGDMLNQYQEYPKFIYNDPLNSKSYIVVNTAHEESLALGGEEIIDDEVERKRLLTLAHVHKVQVDKRWGPAKLIKAIEDAGFDPTLNPFK